MVLDGTRPNNPERGELTPPADGRHPQLGTARNVLYLAMGQVGMTALAIIFAREDTRPKPVRAVLSRHLHDDVQFHPGRGGQPFTLLGEVARDPNRVGELLGTGLALRIIAAPIVLQPLLILTSLLGYDTSIKSILALYFACTLPFSLARGFGTVFRGLDRMDPDALACVVNSAVDLALVVAALALGGGLIAVALCQFAAGLVSLVAAHQFYRRLPATPLAVRRGVAWHLWRGGATIVSLAIVQAAQPYFDVLILSKLAPPDVVGCFGAARNIMGTLLAPAMILAAAVFPQLTRTAQAPGRFGPELRNALRPIMLAGALGAAGTYLFAQTAVQVIYGTHYAPAITILQVFAPLLFLLFVDVLLGHALIAANRTKELAKIKVVSVVVSIALDVVLIPWLQARDGNGGTGVVLAFALSELVMFAGMVAIMPRGTFLPENLVVAAKTIGAAVATVLLLRSIPGLAPAAGIPVAVVVFFVIALALRLVRSSDLALLEKLARRRRVSSVGKESRARTELTAAQAAASPRPDHAD